MILVPKGRRDRWRRILGWAHWPSFVWEREPSPARPGHRATRSILHHGYFFSLLAVAADISVLLAFSPGMRPSFVFAHLLWISGIVSLLLLNPRFLEHLDGRPLESLGWANRLTLARVSLLPLLLYLLADAQWGPALVGYVILGLTDVADGAVARRRHEESKLGFVLDPFGDILFHLGILISLCIAGILSWWTGSLVLARYGLLLGGCLVLYLLKGEIWIQPTPFGKITGLIIATATAALLLLLGIGHPAPSWLRAINHVLLVLFAACLVHVIVIGWINFRRPQQGGVAVYRKGWGLLLGHEPAGARRPSPPEPPAGSAGPAGLRGPGDASRKAREEDGGSREGTSGSGPG